MARRAASALAALLACTALALPVSLLAGQQQAAAATGQRPAQSQTSIVITGMTPQWATPNSTITVTGTLQNTSKTQASRLTVQLLGSSTPVASVAQLQPDASGVYSPASTPLASWQARGPLPPGAIANWSIRVHASDMNMTSFGVYPLAAQAEDVFGRALAVTTTYLPYEPDRKGPYASSRPSAAKIAWLWPVIDNPLLDEPWQGNCSGSQASALVQSIGQDGRLGELVRAGTADSQLTWVVDPAVLANVRALTLCASSQPRWAKAGSVWLAELKDATAGRPLTVTPYGNPNVAALIAVGHGADVTQSFRLGRILAGGILGRSLTAATVSGGGTDMSTLTQASTIAWSAVGVPGYTTLEPLANVDGVRTLVLSTAAFPTEQDSVLQTLDGGPPAGAAGSYLTALLASQSLTQLLGSPSSAPGSAFGTGQQFLAETALLAQIPARPIVVAPPPRWDPPAGLAAALVADTASAPWLSQVSLTSLASAKHIQSVPNQDWPAGSVGPIRVTRPEQRKLRTLDREIGQLEGIRAHPDPDLYLAVSALESSAWQGASNSTVTAMFAAVAGRIDAEQRAVQIVAEKRITLGGLKGSVPVSIDNRLSYPVRVRLQLQYSQASGIKIAADRQGLVTVPAHQTQTIRLQVDATEIGSTTVTMQLATQGGQPLSSTQRMTIQATQVGVLGMIIFAAALGVFLIASAARAIRRGRPGAGADQAASAASADDHEDAGSADRAEPDTVIAERTELGAVGNHGP